MLIKKIRIEIEMPVISASNMDMPVTPPSIKWLDSKNPFKPKPADSMPNTINTASPVIFLNVLFAFIFKYNLILKLFKLLLGFRNWFYVLFA